MPPDFLVCRYRARFAPGDFLRVRLVVPCVGDDVLVRGAKVQKFIPVADHAMIRKCCFVSRVEGMRSNGCVARCIRALDVRVEVPADEDGSSTPVPVCGCCNRVV